MNLVSVILRFFFRLDMPISNDAAWCRARYTDGLSEFVEINVWYSWVAWNFVQNLEQFEAIWGNLGQFGAIWGNLKQFNFIQFEAILGNFGQFWAISCNFLLRKVGINNFVRKFWIRNEEICGNLRQFEAISGNLTQFQAIWATFFRV